MSKPRVDFYIVNDESPDALLNCACRLAEKAYRMGHRLCINADGDSAAARLDDLMWTFRDGSFLPHTRTPGEKAREPVVISEGGDPNSHRDLLINLAGETPGWHAEYSRIAEIVGAAGAARQAGRQRFRTWRERGVEPGTHKI